MKLTKWAVAGLIAATAALTGCSTQAGTTAQVVALQKQVAALSARIDKIEASKVALTNLALQERCAAAAERGYDRVTSAHADARSMYFGYSSYYNTSIGRCLLVYANDVSASEAEGDSRGTHEVLIVNIIDAVGGATYARFMAKQPLGAGVLMCNIRKHGTLTNCTSKQQFDQYRRWIMGVTSPPAQSAR